MRELRILVVTSLLVLAAGGISGASVLIGSPAAAGAGASWGGIQVLSASDVWGVGQTQQDNGSILTLTEKFDGSKWAVVSSPDPGMLGKLVNNSLSAVGTAGDGNLFAVGADELSGQCCLRTLAMGTAKG